MVTGAEMGVALGGIKKVTEILKTLADVLNLKDPDLATAKAKVGELQQVIYELQSGNLELQRRIVELESEKARLEQKISSDDEWTVFGK